MVFFCASRHRCGTVRHRAAPCGTVRHSRAAPSRHRCGTLGNHRRRWLAGWPPTALAGWLAENVRKKNVRITRRWTNVNSVRPKSHCPAPDAKHFAILDGSRCMNVRRNKTEPHFVQSTKLRKATPPRTPRSMLADFWVPGVRSGFRYFRRTRRGSPFSSDFSK